MNFLYRLTIFIGALSILGCQSSEIPLRKGDERELAHLLNRKALQFEARLAEPVARQTLVANRSNGRVWQFGTLSGLVDLNGQEFYLILKGDRVKAVLPYYSQREQFRNMYGRDWIELDIPITDLQYHFNRYRKMANISFRARQHTEPFEIHIRLYGNQKATVSVFSPRRDRIHFYGEVGEAIFGLNSGD